MMFWIQVILGEGSLVGAFVISSLIKIKMNSKRLFNLADNEYQYWKPFDYQGNEINFDHLSAKKYTYTHPERDEHYTLYITNILHFFYLFISYYYLLCQLVTNNFFI